MIPDMIPGMKQLFKKKEAYRKIFRTPDGQIVLKDLAHLCHALEPCFSSDANLMAYKEGKREVFLRILSFIEKDLSYLHELNKELGEKEDDREY